MKQSPWFPGSVNMPCHRGFFFTSFAGKSEDLHMDRLQAKKEKYLLLINGNHVWLPQILFLIYSTRNSFSQLLRSPLVTNQRMFWRSVLITKMESSLNVRNLLSFQNGSRFSGKDKAMTLKTWSFVKKPFRKLEKVPPVLTLENCKRSILCQKQRWN